MCGATHFLCQRYFTQYKVGHGIWRLYHLVVHAVICDFKFRRSCLVIGRRVSVCGTGVGDVCDTIEVNVSEAITPNGDGYNDALIVVGIDCTPIELFIFNRWGKEMFSTTNPETGWDGTLNNEMLSPDVYGYRLEVVCINDVQYVVKGNVSLLR